MKIKKVKHLSTKQCLSYWITERENIRKKKAAKRPKPWTDDEILSQYRFCNVVRMDDKVSKWLMNNWYKPNKGHKNILLATTIARIFNKPETLAAIGFPKKVNLTRMEKIVRKLKADGEAVFNGAYIITGGGKREKPMDKISLVFEQMFKPMQQDQLKIDTTSVQSTAELVTRYWGISTFMSGQISADLRQAVDGSWEDKNIWAPSGPGSKRGINRYLGRDLEASFKESDFPEMLGQVIEENFDVLDPKLANRMEAIDWQNCLCEFDKYQRALNGDGRPKQKYQGIK